MLDTVLLNRQARAARGGARVPGVARGDGDAAQLQRFMRRALQQGAARAWLRWEEHVDEQHRMRKVLARVANQGLYRRRR